MWFYLPSTCCPSVPASPGSTLELDELSRMLERSCTSSGKSRLANSWLRACKTAPLMMRRSSLILHPSTASRGVESWIASLLASRAKATVSPESAASKTTRETSGPPQGDSYGQWEPSGSFWKTCTAFLFQSEANDMHQSAGFSESFRRTGSMRNGRLYPRPTLELRSKGSGCFFLQDESTRWNTPNVEDSVKDHDGQNCLDRLNNGTFRTSDERLRNQVATFIWPAARSEDGEACGNHPGAMDSLTGSTENWHAATANPATYTGGNAPDYDQLPGEVQKWQTPHGMATHDRTGKAGAGGEFAQDVCQWAAAAARDFRSEEATDEFNQERESQARGKPLSYETAHWTAAQAHDTRPRGSGQSYESNGAGNACLAKDGATFSAPSLPAPASDLTALLNRFLRTSKPERWEQMIAFLRSLLSGRSGKSSSKDGPTSPRQSAKTKRRRLNPAFVIWLQGFPEQWLTLAEPTS